MMAAVKSPISALKFASEELRADKELIRYAIPNYDEFYDEDGNRRHFGSILEHLSEDIKSDRDLILSIVKKDGSALEFVSDKLKADKEVVIEAAASFRGSLDYAETSLQSDPDVLSEIKNKVLERIENLPSKCLPLDLQWMGDQEGRYGRVVDDPEIMLAVLRRKAGVVGSQPLDYASERLKDNKELVIFAVRNDGNWALKHASERLKNDPDIRKIMEEQK